MLFGALFFLCASFSSVASSLGKKEAKERPHTEHSASKLLCAPFGTTVESVVKETSHKEVSAAAAGSHQLSLYHLRM